MTHEHNISDDLKQIIRYIVDAKPFSEYIAYIFL